MLKKDLAIFAACACVVVSGFSITRIGNGGGVENTADAVYLNGKVFTSDEASRMAEAFAVKDGRFVAVGTSDEIKKFIGEGTSVIDLKRHLVTPGLADGHFHNEGGGPGFDLSKTRTLAELLAAVAQAVYKAAPGELVISNADWHEAQLKEKRLPRATEIDSVSPNNPVVLIRGGHEYILNSQALHKWNITRETASPEGGSIGKDPDGSPNGELVDSAKQLVQLPPAPPLSVEDILKTQKTLNAYGITSVRIPGSYRGNLFQTIKLMNQMRDANQLTLRFSIYLPGFGDSDPAKIRQMIATSGLKLDEGDEWVRIIGIKLAVDGGFEGGHMTQPYQEPYGKGGKYSGLTLVPADQFTEMVKEINRMGWRVATHAVGDAGLDQVLDAYETANAERSIAGKRWAVEHAFVVRPDQLKRLKKLDVILSVQDHLYLAAPTLKKYWGTKRAADVTPVRTYLDNGFLVIGGTDSPVVPFNPFWELYHFHTRDTMTDGLSGVDQVVRSRSTLLRMITSNYSKAVGEDMLGAIEVGKLADFAILSEDLLTVPAREMLKIKAVATYVGGKEVYRDPADKSLP
jgi:predicted amidohydrolase YtcJ